MRELLMITILALTSFYTNGQVISRCDCSILVDPDFTGKIQLYNKPGGKILRSIGHDFKNQDYLYLIVKNENDTMFYVSASYSIKEDSVVGWIKKTPELGIYSRVYGENERLVLHNFPTKHSRQAVSPTGYISGLLPVLSCKGKWLRVGFRYKSKQYSGWLSPEKQCDNVYTTCN